MTREGALAARRQVVNADRSQARRSLHLRFLRYLRFTFCLPACLPTLLAVLFGGEKARRIGADAAHLAFDGAGQAEIVVHRFQAG